MRSFISAVAFLVKVSVKISLGLAPLNNRAKNRTLKAKVFPLPAEAFKAMHCLFVSIEIYPKILFCLYYNLKAFFT